MQKLINEIVYTYLKTKNLLKRHKYASLNVSNIQYIPILTPHHWRVLGISMPKKALDAVLQPVVSILQNRCS